MRFSLLVILTLITGGLSVPAAADDLRDPWVKGRWIEQAGEALTGRVDFAARDQLMEHSPDDIVSWFMEQPGFGDQVLSFYLRFLGFRGFELRRRINGVETYSPEIYAHPDAIAAARALMQDGPTLDVFLRMDQPFFRPPPGRNEAAILRSRDGARQLLDEALARSSGAGKMSRSDCNALRNSAGQLVTLFRQGGIGEDTGRAVAAYALEPVDRLCRAAQQKPAKADMAPLVRAYRDLVEAVFARAQADRRTPPQPASVTEIPLYDRDAVGVDLPSSRLTFSGFWDKFQNSSTNHNRLRAQYILNTWFCDDLTPVDVPVTGSSADHEGLHAADAACQSCHFRLDPIGGFFRDYGKDGLNFAGTGTIRFDDNDVFSEQRDPQQYHAYYDTWRDSPESGREWNVGYVRSVTDTSLNDYGDSLDDLFGIISAAPEFRSCLVRRMAAWFIDEHQVFDGGWLQDLQAEFDREANQSAAFRKIVRRLVLSRTFITPFRSAEQCYDFAPGGAASAVPCRVSHILEASCGSCHNSARAAGGLDLTTWVDGRFPHQRGGLPVDPQETMASMRERLNATQPGYAMPLFSHISTQDKVALLQWLETSGSVP